LPLCFCRSLFAVFLTGKMHYKLCKKIKINSLHMPTPTPTHTHKAPKVETFTKG
jgi:hypothetical protein